MVDNHVVTAAAQVSFFLLEDNVFTAALFVTVVNETYFHGLIFRFELAQCL
jgi:hypothetical protein